MAVYRNIFFTHSVSCKANGYKERIVNGENTDHSTMKPIPLLAYPIQNSSMSNTLVLDPFGGSGSTLIACEQTDRSCYTIELGEKYCDVIVKRYIEQTGSSDGVTVERDGKTYAFAELEVRDG